MQLELADPRAVAQRARACCTALGRPLPQSKQSGVWKFVLAEAVSTLPDRTMTPQAVSVGRRGARFASSGAQRRPSAKSSEKLAGQFAERLIVRLKISKRL